MNHKKLSARARIGALVLAAAATTAFAGAFAVSDGPQNRRAISIEPGVQRSEIATDRGCSLVCAIEDPELSRTDRANDHHG